MKGKITRHDFNSDTACIGLKLTRLGRRFSSARVHRDAYRHRCAIVSRCEVQEIQILGGDEDESARRRSSNTQDQDF
jgi:hypothetical protein